jgi:hypothetical protein
VNVSLCFVFCLSVFALVYQTYLSVIIFKVITCHVTVRCVRKTFLS